MVLCVHVEKLEATQSTAHGRVVVWTALVVHTTVTSLECTALGRGRRTAKVDTCERSLKFVFIYLIYFFI